MDNKHKLNDKFDPKDFEDKIYKNWEEKAKKFIKCSHKY